ncbi:hypothetical protein ACJMK2_002558 [Sinanodonta woodiana]|uniref:Uncharacterized protein n=1 Tax=Sinanodonta woodiana TaxID=1069815 RepID=A0ABD3XYV0_SINWO
MRNLVVVLLLLVFCSIALSEDLRKSRSYVDNNDDNAALKVLLKAIDDGKIDLNVIQSQTTNKKKRLFWPSWPTWLPRLPVIHGK